jgi:hypothetical protein
MAPAVLTHPGTWPTETEWNCGRDNSSATRATLPGQPGTKGQREAKELLVLPGRVFLGSIGYHGEEVYAAIRCKSCDATADLERS